MKLKTKNSLRKHFQTFIYEGNGGGQRVGRFIPFTDNGTISDSCLFNDGDSIKGN